MIKHLANSRMLGQFGSVEIKARIGSNPLIGLGIDTDITAKAIEQCGMHRLL
jgi:hypothetical protein